MPAVRSLLAPLLRIRETVPEVVGFQLRARGVPAVAERPEGGMLKGLDCAKARRGEAQSARM